MSTRLLLSIFILFLFPLSGRAQGLQINEYLPAPKSNQTEFVELIWTGDKAFEASKLQFRDARPVWSSIHSTASIQPGEIFLIAREASRLNLDSSVQVFELQAWPALNNGGDSLIVALDGIVQNRAGYSGSSVISGVSRERISIEKPAVDQENWTLSTHSTGSTPGQINTAISLDRDWADPPHSGDLEITEIMFDPLADPTDFRPDQVEFVEVMNISGRSVNLKGLWLGSLPDEKGNVDSLLLAPDNLELESEALAVFFQTLDPPVETSEIPCGLGNSISLADVNSEARCALSSIWPAIWTTAWASSLFVHQKKSLGLSNKGEFILLKNLDGETTTESWFHPDMHHPVFHDSKGVSLERLHVEQSITRNGSFTSSAHPDGATPGFRLPIANDSASTDDEALRMEVDPDSFYPERVELPFATTITVFNPLLGESGVVSLNVYDLEGRHRRNLTPGRLFVSDFSINWDGRDDAGRLVPTGFYVILATVISGQNRRTHQLKHAVSLLR